MNPVRKSLLLILVLLLTALCACAAANSEYPLDSISGRVSVNEDRYIVLTSGNLADHPDLLSAIGKTAEELQADWTERGVRLQAWQKDMKVRIEVSVVQDEDSARYYDLKAQDNGTRGTYYKEQKTKVTEQGYIVNESDHKLYSKSGYYFVFEYLLRGDAGQYRGIMRKNIRNGYTLIVDYRKMDGTKLSKTDKDRSNTFMNGIVIDDLAPAPAAGTVTGQETNSGADTPEAPAGVAGTLSVTVLPPAETNDGVFTVEGTAYPGSEVIVIGMRWTGTSHRFTTTATKAGRFKVNVALPEEGLYQFTINMCLNGNEQPVADAVLNTTSYLKSLLPLSLDAEIPEVLTSDELVISGTTVKNVTIQCIVSNGTMTFDKTVKTNGTGKFKFKIPTAQEGEYSIILALAKKGLDSKRLTWTATRSLTAEDNRSRTISSARKVSYANLTKKLDTYIGSTLVYEAHIVDVKEVGDEWIITAALKLNKGTYSDFLIYMAGDNPGLAPGAKVKLYGTCIGAYQEQSEEDGVNYPGFDYLYFE